jgi:hypothetical protein
MARLFGRVWIAYMLSDRFGRLCMAALLAVIPSLMVGRDCTRRSEYLSVEPIGGHMARNQVHRGTLECYC